MFKVCGNSIWRTGVIRYSGRDGTGRDGMGRDPYRGVFAFSDRLFFISWGWGGRDSGGLSLNNIYPIYRYFRNIFRTPFLGS